MDRVIAGTARNLGEIEAFGGSFSEPPTQAEMQAFADYEENFRRAIVRSGSHTASSRRRAQRQAT